MKRAFARLPMVVAGVIAGRNRADITIFPPDIYSTQSGDKYVIISNALLYK